MTRAVPEKHIINFFWPNTSIPFLFDGHMSSDRALSAWLLVAVVS